MSKTRLCALKAPTAANVTLPDGVREAVELFKNMAPMVKVLQSQLTGAGGLLPATNVAQALPQMATMNADLHSKLVHARTNWTARTQIQYKSQRGPAAAARTTRSKQLESD